MGWEPVTYCAKCREASDVYEPGYWLCEGCAEEEKTPQTWEEMIADPKAYHKNTES